MDRDMLDKITHLFETGKITESQKVLLINALEEQGNQNEEKLCVGSVLCCKGEDQAVHIKLISENLQIKGAPMAQQINFLKGMDAITVSKSETSVNIQSKKSSGQHAFFSDSSDETIVLQSPCQTRISAKTVSGDVEILHMHNAVVAKSVSGSIQARDIDGNLTILTVSGDIEVENASNVSELVSKSGDINIQDSTISGIFKSYSGDIFLKDSIIADAEIAVFSGEIKLAPSKMHGNIFIKTFSGDVKLEISSECKKDIKNIMFVSQSGEIHCKGCESNEFNQKQRIEVNKNGTVEITIKTTSGNGNITIG